MVDVDVLYIRRLQKYIYVKYSGVISQSTHQLIITIIYI